MVIGSGKQVKFRYLEQSRGDFDIGVKPDSLAKASSPNRRIDVLNYVAHY
jgi:hypothetical protein